MDQRDFKPTPKQKKNLRKEIKNISKKINRTNVVVGKRDNKDPEYIPHPHFGPSKEKHGQPKATQILPSQRF